MADQEQAAHSGFPDPPSFWRDFTPERLLRIKQLRREYKDATGVEPPARLPDLPDDLINLQPPAEPSDGRWRVFNSLYTLKDELPSLEEQDIPRLIPAPPTDRENPTSRDERTHADRALTLKRLAKSLLLNFLELVGVMGSTPEHGEEKLADIRSLFMNMEHAINEYRPHQAREQLIAQMQEHLDRTRAETAALRAATDKTRCVLEGLGSIEVPDLESLVDRAGRRGGAGGDDLNPDAEKATWATLDAVFV